MAILFTIPESLATLEKATGSRWSEKKLFNAVLYHNQTLQSVPPHNATLRICESKEGSFPERAGLPISWRMAQLDNHNIEQLIMCGETETITPVDEDELVAVYGGVWCVFDEPVHATPDTVRVPLDTLEHLENAGDLLPPLTATPAAKDEAGAVTSPSGDELKTEEIHCGLDGAPSLKKGRNDREKVNAWVVWQASNKVKKGDNITDLADRIKLEADKWGYESERKNKNGNYKLTTANIIKMIPAETTGGRAKNTGKPKKRIGTPIQI